MLSTTLKNLLSPQPSRRQHSQCSSHTPEALEQRTLLSNVSVAFDGHNLVIEGDRDDNAILVARTAGDDGPKVLVAVDESTTINDEGSTFVIPVDRITGDLQIRLHGGNNHVLFSSMLVEGNVTVKGGRGADAFGMAVESEIVGDFIMKGSAGNDSFAMGESGIRGDVRLNMGSGRDTIGLSNAFVSGDFIASTGSGNDRIGLNQSELHRNFVAKTAGGADAIMVEESDVSRSSNINTGSGNDDIAFIDSNFGDTVSANGASGNDSLAHEGAWFVRGLSERSIEGDEVEWGLINDFIFHELTEDFASVFAI